MNFFTEENGKILISLALQREGCSGKIGEERERTDVSKRKEEQKNF